mmetsp:Transcript_1848/g.3780  ORF Transcript_1848/g.3780 Transcript_1848/m.3780 type:complete len:153 (-) Transcript_1848:26-484(-)
MQGLWDGGCLKKVKLSSLPKDAKGFGSSLHCKIKHDSQSGLITQTKVRLVVQGDRMTKGEDYEDSFAPVPRSASVRILFAIAAADDMHVEKVDFTQAFIQASWDHLPEGFQGKLYIRQPKGVEEDPDTVYQVCKPLYGIPSSARALHFTLDD